MNDLINGALEMGGAYFISRSVRQLLKDKAYSGFDPCQVLFFTCWGYWNLFYYPSLHQPLSFAGGAALAAMNTAYVSLLWRFRHGRPAS